MGDRKRRSKTENDIFRSRFSIRRVDPRLKTCFFLSPFAPENLVSRDRFGRPIPHSIYELNALRPCVAAPRTFLLYIVIVPGLNGADSSPCL